MGGKSSKSSADPMAGWAAMMQAQTGQKLADLSQQELEFQRGRYEQYDPLYQQIINQQISQSIKNDGRSDEQWQHYKDIFQPIEKQMAADAMNYDNADEVARREGLAAVTVAKQFDASDAQMSRDMARMGVSPTGSMGQQSMINQANARALGKAGAVNQERSNTKLLGIQLRQQAANFGRNMPNTGLAASGTATNAGNSAAGNIGNSLQAAGLAGQNAGSLLGAAGSQYGGAANAFTNLAGMHYQQNASNNAGLGQLLGTGASLGMMAFSSKELKEDKQPISDEAALEGLENVPVEQWKYKEGVADEGQHIGPYAEDMNQQFGDAVAPGGIGLDLVSVQGKHHAAIRALGKKEKAFDKRLQRIENAVGLQDAILSSDALPEELQADLTPAIIGMA